MKNRILLIGFFLFGTFMIKANGIEVSGVNFNSTTNQLSFTLTWENSWTEFSGEPDLHDAAWVFIKYAPNGGDIWYHANILDSIPVQNYIQYISYDDLGIMIYKSTVGSETFGPQQFTVELGSLTGSYHDFKVFATETVFIDNGNFYAGDAISPGRFYDNGNQASSWYIESENAIMRGDLVGEFNQQGSSSTQDLSADFPKGYNSFFSMKYKITAQQYVDFLNCLDRFQQQTRTAADISGTTVTNRYVMSNTSVVTDRNPIRCPADIGTGAIEFYLDLDPNNPPNSANDGGNIALNYLTAADIYAYLDWSGMRPMTELEFEKICRGRDMLPVAQELAWGTSTHNPAGSITNSGSSSETTAFVGIDNSLYLEAPLRVGYAATSTSKRTDSGATFWGVMDVHNLAEFMIGVESLNFSKDSYGDGFLTPFGNANVSDWTVGVKLLRNDDGVTPAPISQGKAAITPVSRLANMGARGVRKLIQE